MACSRSQVRSLYPPPLKLDVIDYFLTNYLKSLTNDFNILSKFKALIISLSFSEFQALATSWLLFGYLLTLYTLLYQKSDLVVLKLSKLKRKTMSACMAESGSYIRDQRWQKIGQRG